MNKAIELILKFLLPEVVKQLSGALRDWIKEYLRQRRNKKLSEGLEENDSKKVEEALGNDSASKPSEFDGVQTRTRDKS